MGWERRERGGRYYTRSRKVGGRVVREYVGTGAVAEIAARTDARERAHHQAVAASEQEEREGQEATEKAVSELCEVSEVLARVALVAAGYRQHHRGEWRRRRGRAQGDAVSE